MGPKPLRSLSLRQPHHAARAASQRFLLEAACSVHEPIAQHLGYSFLRVAQSQGLALPRQEIHKLCPSCGAPSTPRDFARVVKLQPRKARRKQQAQAALSQTRERRDTVTNKAGLLRKCTVCGTVRVRPYYTVNLVLEAAKREGLVVSGVQTPKPPAHCPRLTPPSTDVAPVAALASTMSESMRVSVDMAAIRLESQTTDAWCTLAGVEEDHRGRQETEPVVVMNPLLPGVRGGKSKTPLEGVGGPGIVVGAGQRASGQQPSLYSSLMESDASLTMHTGEYSQLPDLNQMGCMKQDRNVNPSYGVFSVPVTSDIELVAMCNDESLPVCLDEIQGLGQPLEGSVFAQREVLESTGLDEGSPDNDHQELGSPTGAHCADGITFETGSEEPGEGNLSKLAVPNASPCHDTQGGQVQSDCQLPKEGMSPHVMCLAVGEVHATALVASAGFGTLNGQRKASLAQTNLPDTHGLDEHAGSNDESELEASHIPSGGDLQGSNSAGHEAESLLESQGGSQDKGKVLIRDDPSLAHGASQGIDSAGAGGRGQCLGGEVRGRRNSLKSRTWFKLGRTWKCI